MNNRKLEFRVDTMSLLNEIVDCAFRENQGVLKVPLNVFKNLLAQTAVRATELNDPKLNILMLKLGLYEVPPMEIHKKIEDQIELIEKRLFELTKTEVDTLELIDIIVFLFKYKHCKNIHEIINLKTLNKGEFYDIYCYLQNEYNDELY